MKGLNKVLLIGALGRDPETKIFSNGGKMVTASLATGSFSKDKETEMFKEKTEWHRIIFYDHLAARAEQFLVKGSKVFIEGTLKTRKWTDKNNQDHYITEIIVKAMTMLDSRQDREDNSNEEIDFNFEEGA